MSTVADAADGGDSEEFEMEVTDDMLNFFAASAKHRHLRGLRRLPFSKRLVATDHSTQRAFILIHKPSASFGK